MKPSRISKDGVNLHHWCPDCKDDKYHHVIVLEYKPSTVRYGVVCYICYAKWVDKKSLKDKGILNEVEDLEGYIYETDIETWNELLKFSR